MRSDETSASRDRAESAFWWLRHNGAHQSVKAKRAKETSPAFLGTIINTERCCLA